MGTVYRPLASVAMVLLVVLAGCGTLGLDGGADGTESPAVTSTSTGGGGPAGTSTVTATSTATDTTGETPTPEPSPTVESESGIRVVEISADPEGKDRNNLNEEYIVVKNTGDAPIDLTGWRVKDEDGHVYTFPDGFTLEIGQTVTLHTSRGTQSDSDLFWWSDRAVWDNDGDTIAIFDERGHKLYERSYD